MLTIRYNLNKKVEIPPLVKNFFYWNKFGGGFACFFNLPRLFIACTSVDFIVNYNKNLNPDAAKWFLEEIKKWGFDWEKATNIPPKYSTQNIVRVVKQKTILHTLIPLMLLRYLDKSEGIHFIVNKTFEWSTKYPDLHSFELFQIAHLVYKQYNDYGFNYNHTLLHDCTGYEISSLDLFKRRLENSRNNVVDILLMSGNVIDDKERFNKLLKKEDLYEIIAEFRQEL